MQRIAKLQSEGLLIAFYVLLIERDIHRPRRIVTTLHVVPCGERNCNKVGFGGLEGIIIRQIREERRPQAIDL